MKAKVDPEEQAEAHERARPRTAVIFEAIREEGEDELERSPASLAWSALAAGLSMTLGLVAMGAFAADLPDTPWRPLIVSLGYPLGYVIVILGRQQLFTENTLTPLLPILARPTPGRIARLGALWGIVLTFNIIGALIGATFLALSHAMNVHAEAPMADLGAKLMQHAPVTRFAQAIFAGWLIALMVWLLPLAEGAGPLVIFVITYVVGIAEFSHIVAGSVEVFYASWSGRVPWSEYPAFFIPTLLGNVVGGVTFVALIAFATMVSENPKSRNEKPPKGNLAK
ncbi:MAG TPA: formate/nitrite transporter family protein [Candidatus Lustribacter sp.]